MPGGSEPTKTGSEKAAIAQTQQSCGSRMIKIHSAVPGGGESKRKSAVWLTVFPERRLA